MCTFSLWYTSADASLQTTACTLYSIQSIVINLFVCLLFCLFLFVCFADAGSASCGLILITVLIMNITRLKEIKRSFCSDYMNVFCLIILHAQFTTVSMVNDFCIMSCIARTISDGFPGIILYS